MNVKVAVFGTFDTKGREFDLLKSCIEQNRLQTILIDTGLTRSTYLQGDYIIRDLLRQEGKALEDVSNAAHRAEYLELISVRAADLIETLQRNGQIRGAISMGGGQGTYIAGKILRALPIGFPKVLLSTLALVEGSAAQFTHLNDTVVLNSLVDVAGINSLLKKTILSAAGSLCGMVRAFETCDDDKMPAVAISAWGVVTPCINRVRDFLDERGIEPLVFHSNGEGGMVLESLSRQGAVDAVVDVCWSEESIALAGGPLPFVPGRLEGAAEGHVPRVMAPGGLDMILVRKEDILPGGKFHGRPLYQHNPEVRFVRSKREENIAFGKHMAQKLNKATAPVKLLLPLKGLSAIDCEGQIFYGPRIDRVLFDVLWTEITNPLVEIREVPYHINSPQFAAEVIGELTKILQKENYS